MNIEEELKLNKKLTDWLNLEVERFSEGFIIYKDKDSGVALHCKLFTRSFDACKDFLIPKLNKLGLTLYFHQFKRGWNVNLIWLEDIGYKRRQRVTNEKYETLDKDMTLAFCKMVEKVIDQGKDKVRG